MYKNLQLKLALETLLTFKLKFPIKNLIFIYKASNFKFLQTTFNRFTVYITFDKRKFSKANSHTD